MRGNWRNDRQAAFMLLQKSCHDIDWIRYVMEQPCEQVSSFGNLRHFRRENQPAGAADNCLIARWRRPAPIPPNASIWATTRPRPAFCAC